MIQKLQHTQQLDQNPNPPPLHLRYSTRDENCLNTFALGSGSGSGLGLGLGLGLGSGSGLGSGLGLGLGLGLVFHPGLNIFVARWPFVGTINAVQHPTNTLYLIHTPIHPYTIHPYTHTPIHPYTYTPVHHTPTHPRTHTLIHPYTLTFFFKPSTV